MIEIWKKRRRHDPLWTVIELQVALFEMCNNQHLLLA